MDRLAGRCGRAAGAIRYQRHAPDQREPFRSRDPGYEIFAQLPWRRQIIHGLLGADLLGFQRHGDTANFLRACRQAAGLATRGSLVRVLDSANGDGGNAVGPRSRSRRHHADGFAAGRVVRAAAFPISIDSAAFGEIARREDVRARARAIRKALGEPGIVFLGVDRLDYTKGILHRLTGLQRAAQRGPARTRVGVGAGGKP
jgi:trehalose-6-phosphate synthase